MPKDFSNCGECPFNPYNKTVAKRAHTFSCTVLNALPLEKEAHNSKTLLVFEDPGIIEWEHRIPIFDARKPDAAGKSYSNSAGSLIAHAFEVCKMNRTDYDITEAVQCFPDIKANKIQSEIDRASIFCLHNLFSDIYGRGYSKIICFGDVAERSVLQVVEIIKSIDSRYSIFPTKLVHPSAMGRTLTDLINDIKQNL